MERLSKKKTAEEIAKELAKRDDYRMEGKEKEKEHRLSRVKRRRQEAIEASKSAIEDENGEEGDDDGEYSEGL